MLQFPACIGASVSSLRYTHTHRGSQSSWKLCRGSVESSTIRPSWLCVYRRITGATSKTTLNRWNSYTGHASNRYSPLAHVTMHPVTAGYTHTHTHHDLFQSNLHNKSSMLKIHSNENELFNKYILIYYLATLAKLPKLVHCTSVSTCFLCSRSYLRKFIS